MKTKEFIKLIEGADFTVEDAGDYLYVSKVHHSGYTSGLYGRVSKKHEYCFDTNYILFAQLCTDIRGLITSALYAYSQTPIEERESIELSAAERVILESISHEYRGIRLDDDGVLTLENFIGLEYHFCMFGELFGWVEKDEIYEIYDLLNDWEVTE